MKGLKERFGRPLRLGMIGGGPDSWIGRMHQGAASLDGWWQVVAGVCSSDPERSRTAGVALGIDPARSYGDVAEMFVRERERPDGIDAVAIMTPNDTHYPFAAAALGARLDVICDKPVSHDFAQACDLVSRTRATSRLFAVTHGYAAYPMTRYAARLVRDGELGPIRFVQVEYIQSGVATRLEDGPQNNRLRWLFDPHRSGLAQVMSAIGCHAQHLACFTTGRDVARVCADATSVVPGRRTIDHMSALMEFDGGFRGTFTALQAAAGSENDIRLRVYGERGMVDWSHRECSYLKVAMLGEPVRLIGRGDPGLPSDIIGAGRAPRGHPEGLLQAFANIYGEVAQERMAREVGDETPSFPYPRIEDGAHSMAFIEACLASHAAGGWVDVAGAGRPVDVSRGGL
jgi:predicted dehydrogenase